MRRARKYVSGGGIETLGALTPGDYVVHLEHGIGIYRGIERVFVRDTMVEVAVIERAAMQLRDGGAIEGVLEWPALLRRLERIDPSYRA